MYLIPPTEKLIETKICRHCSISFPITDKDMEFYKKVSPTFGGKKYSIPTPTLCPDCRQQRRESVKNIHCLYKYENTGIVSTYSPDKGLFVLTQKTWWEDNSLGMQFGRDYDFSRQFFEQFHELQKVAPRWNLIQIFSENCEWCINTSDSKNSYFIKSGKNAENCFYGERVFSSKNIIDGYRILNSDSCYDSWFLADCYQVFWSYKTRFSQNSLFLFECDNVTFCLGCTGLQHKTYHILNMPVTEKEYHECRKNILTSRSFRDEFKNKFVDLYMKTPRKNLDTFESENFNGDEIFNSKNAKCSFSVRDSEDIAYAYDGSFAKSCMDVNAPDEQELCYETSSNYKLHHDVFCFNSIYLNRCFYVETCANLNDCFGCVGLNHKSYCILNKQYTKEEYEVLVPRIIEHMMKTGEWGEFFPSSLSPFGYNETVAMEYFPLSREAVLGKAPFGKELSEVKRKTEDFRKIETENPSPAIAGTPFQKGAYFNWSDYESPFPKVDKIIPASKLPDDISKIPDDILNWAIECEVTKKPFRIIRQELEFYRKHNLPIPRRHPDQRHLDRMALRNPRKLFERKCDKCGKDMITSYSPEREEIVYCEECYNREVIG